jgi:hypothetical protein
MPVRVSHVDKSPIPTRIVRFFDLPEQRSGGKSWGDQFQAERQQRLG